jgi:hypothetical protein
MRSRRAELIKYAEVEKERSSKQNKNTEVKMRELLRCGRTEH